MGIKKLCSKCNKVIPFGQIRCSKCEEKYQTQKQSNDKYYNKYSRDKKSQQFYNSREWKNVKEYIKNRDLGLCVMCRVEGVIGFTEVIHHIIPIKDEYDKRLDNDNLISLCNKHHNKVHAAYDSDYLNKARTQKELFELINISKK